MFGTGVYNRPPSRSFRHPLDQQGAVLAGKVLDPSPFGEGFLCSPFDFVVLSDNIQSMPVLLRHWRERRGYSVRELAKRAGVGFVTVSRIENGHISPTVTMLEKLAKALGISVRDFFPARRAARQVQRRR